MWYSKALIIETITALSASSQTDTFAYRQYKRAALSIAPSATINYAIASKPNGSSVKKSRAKGMRSGWSMISSGCSDKPRGPCDGLDTGQFAAHRTRLKIITDFPV